MYFPCLNILKQNVFYYTEFFWIWSFLNNTSPERMKGRLAGSVESKFWKRDIKAAAMEQDPTEAETQAVARILAGLGQVRRPHRT